jgi:hypothetical protein
MGKQMTKVPNEHRYARGEVLLQVHNVFAAISVPCLNQQWNC